MRTKRVILNFITDVLPQIIIAILGIYKIKIFLKILGSDTLGLYQLYSQIIAYLVLAEGGIGTAVLFRLYKPIKNKDTLKIKKVMSTAKTLFRYITLIIIVLGIIISFIIKFFIKSVDINNLYIIFTFIIFLFGEGVLYLTVPEKCRFDAEQKKYIPNLIFQIGSILKSISEIVFVIIFKDLTSILLSILVINIITNVIFIIIYRKYYGKIDTTIEKDFTIVKDSKHLFVNTIGNLITSNIDIIIISKFLGLGYVVIYTTYNYIIDTLRKILEKITSSTMSGIANVLNTNKKQAYNIFLEYNSFTFFTATIICVPLLFVINSFISIWYENEILTTVLLASLFVGCLFYQIIRIPLRTYTFAAGEFAKIKKYVIFECIINLSLSLILVNFFGISGVLIGTLISFLSCDYIPKASIILKKILGYGTKKYYLSHLKYSLIVLIEILILVFIPMKPSNIFIWFIYSLIIFIAVFAITLAYYHVIKEDSFIKRFNLKNIFRKEKVNE